MDILYSCVPSIDDSMCHQNEASEISDQEFHDHLKTPVYKWYHRLYQILCFFIFMGPLRVLLAVVSLVIMAILVLSIRLTLRFFGCSPNTGRHLCFRIVSVAFRIVMISFGQLWIQVQGSLDKDTRFVIANHTAFVDPFVPVQLADLSAVCKKEVASNKLIKEIIDVCNPIYVDRSKSTGASKQIADHADDYSLPPILVYPEGTINDGSFLLQFHRSAFLTQHKVQPVCVRYWMPLVPKYWNTHAWTNFNTLDYFFCLFSLPPSWIKIDILAPMTLEVEGKGDIEHFTKYAQLVMANHLHVKAITHNSNEIYRVRQAIKDKEKDKQQ